MEIKWTLLEDQSVHPKLKLNIKQKQKITRNLCTDYQHINRKVRVQTNGCEIHPYSCDSVCGHTNLRGGTSFARAITSLKLPKTSYKLPFHHTRRKAVLLCALILMSLAVTCHALNRINHLVD